MRRPTTAVACPRRVVDDDGFSLVLRLQWQNVTLSLLPKCEGRIASNKPDMHEQRCAVKLLKPVIAKARELFGETRKLIEITTMAQLRQIGDALRDACLAQNAGVNKALSTTGTDNLKAIFFIVIVVLEYRLPFKGANKLVWTAYASGHAHWFIPSISDKHAITMAKVLLNNMPAHVQEILADVDGIKQDIRTVPHTGDDSNSLSLRSPTAPVEQAPPRRQLPTPAVMITLICATTICLVCSIIGAIISIQVTMHIYSMVKDGMGPLGQILVMVLFFL